VNTIRIDRLDLRCRGIRPATAQAALGELSSAMLRRLTERDETENHNSVIFVSGNTAPTELADAIAARVAAAVHARVASGSKPTRS